MKKIKKINRIITEGNSSTVCTGPGGRTPDFSVDGVSEAVDDIIELSSLLMPMEETILKKEIHIRLLRKLLSDLRLFLLSLVGELWEFYTQQMSKLVKRISEFVALHLITGDVLSTYAMPLRKMSVVIMTS